MKFLINGLVISVLYFSSSLFPADAEDVLYADTLMIRGLLESKSFEELNNKLSELQKLYEVDIKNETNLDLAFRAFSLADPVYENLINEWIKQSPDHYFPYLARAHYYSNLGWYIYNNKKSKLAKSRNPRQLHEKALLDFDKAISLNPDITISYSGKITITGEAFGDSQLTRQTMISGLKVNPASYEIRKAYFFTLPSRNKEIKNDFLAETKRHESENENLIPLRGLLEYDIGYRYRVNDKFDECIEHINKAIQHGDKAWYYYNRGICHFFLDDMNKALSDFNRAVQLWPQYADALQWRSWTLRKLDKSNDTKALEDLDLALELDPYDFRALIDRGYLLAEFEQYEEAVDDFKRALEINESRADTWYILGWHLSYHLNKSREGAEAFQKAHEIDSDNPEYVFHYAVALNNIRDCKMLSALEKYSGLCKNSNRQACSNENKKWAREMHEFVQSSNFCP